MQAELETDSRQGQTMQIELVRGNRQNVYTGTPRERQQTKYTGRVRDRQQTRTKYAGRTHESQRTIHIDLERDNVFR